jgi:hypothetical protein
MRFFGVFSLENVIAFPAKHFTKNISDPFFIIYNKDCRHNVTSWLLVEQIVL